MGRGCSGGGEGLGWEGGVLVDERAWVGRGYSGGGEGRSGSCWACVCMRGGVFLCLCICETLFIRLCDYSFGFETLLFVF